MVVVSAPDGVQIGTERAWTVAERLELPRMLVVTKLDRGGDFYALLDDLRTTLGPILPIQLPWIEDGRWVGLIDVLHDTACRYDGGSQVTTPVPKEEFERLQKFRQEVIEGIVETDEGLLERYLGNKELSKASLAGAFHTAVRRGLLYPVAIASGISMIGLASLMDTFIEALPSPEERFGEGPTLAKVFKVQVDPYMGQVAYIRLFRGNLKPGDILKTEDGTVKFTHLYTPKGKELVEVQSAEAGFILTLPKTDNLHRGMGLWMGEPEEVPRTRLPEPTSVVAISPGSRNDDAKLGEALKKLLEEDPSLKLERQSEVGEMLLWGMGDLHLEVARERLVDYGVNVTTHTPTIPYRETIHKSADAQGKYKKQTGGHGQYGDVRLKLSPAEGYEFKWSITGGTIPTKYKESVEKGVLEAAKKGVLAGYPVMGFRVSVYHGSYHEVDSSDIAFQGYFQMQITHTPQPHPSLKLERQSEVGEMLLWGMGDLHLEVARERLVDYGVNVTTHTPTIPYRETIHKSADAQGKYKKQTGGHGQYGDVRLKLSPAEGYEFKWSITGGTIPTKYKESVEKGVLEAAKKGVLAGYPVMGFRVSVYHGSYHEVDSSDIAFQVAGAMAFKSAMQQAGPYLLEPIYRIKVFAPHDKLGDILADLQGRRGRILGMDTDGALQIIQAEAPLAELLEYSRTLRSVTGGQGAFSMEFARYAEMPTTEAGKVMAKRTQEST